MCVEQGVNSIATQKINACILLEGGSIGCIRSLQQEGLHEYLEPQWLEIKLGSQYSINAKTH